MKIEKKIEIVCEFIDLSLVYFSYYVAVIIFDFLFAKKLLFADVIAIVPIAIIISFIFFRIFATHKFSEEMFLGVFANIVLSNLLTIIILIVIAFATNMTDFASKIFVIVFVLELATMSIYKYVLYILIRKKRIPLNLIFVGKYDEYKRISEKNRTNSSKYNISYVSNFDDISFDENLCSFDGIILGCSINKSNNSEKIKKFQLMQKIIYIVPDVIDINIHSSRLELINEVPLFSLKHIKMSEEDMFIKRMFDIIVSIVLLSLSLPIFIVISLILFIIYKNSVFYVQERSTYKGKIFKIIKFRTMIVNAEAETGPTLSESKDSRVTKFGKVLRKYRIDELPQLVNVLLGDMSIVGPRPERPFFDELYQNNVPNYTERLNVKAGITGLAQVFGNYSTDVEDKLKLDLIYIANYSFLLDVYILIRTIKVVFISSGSSKKKSSVF